MSDAGEATHDDLVTDDEAARILEVEPGRVAVMIDEGHLVAGRPSALRDGRCEAIGAVGGRRGAVSVPRVSG